MGKKEEEQKAEEEKKQKEEKRKKKIKDKALANLAVNLEDRSPNELPPIDQNDFVGATFETKRMTRGNSVSGFGSTKTRGLSLSARPSEFNREKSKNVTQEDFSSEHTTQTQISSKSGIPRLPRSRK